jgi:hypothetical protein
MQVAKAENEHVESEKDMETKTGNHKTQNLNPIKKV